ncbi:mediator of RNA polymerase II transcription subunit 25-like isoform X2 [Cornus florida]|uniref:mediator of RNA polymerase II transcription subunit 25-like isoform X2 n=1 Tax=Cornus florida TaxID=4283 RepID=UPI00289FEAF1|nr:mediator of RNA polymerase II transcription subunit 25-like isoform X2 [Cornus florida]
MSTSDKIAADWPRTLHVDQLVSQHHINNIPYDGEVEYLIIEAMHHRRKFDELKEKRLCAYIKLPPQTLLLTVSTNSMRFIGTLYLEGFPLYKHQIYIP